MIWLHIVNNGRNARFKAQKQMQKIPFQAGAWAQKFRQLWYENNIMASWQQSKPEWQRIGLYSDNNKLL